MAYELTCVRMTWAALAILATREGDDDTSDIRSKDARAVPSKLSFDLSVWRRCYSHAANELASVSPFTRLAMDDVVA